MAREADNPMVGLATKQRLRVAGLMSGTSADGVDVAIADLDGRRVEVLAFDTYRYPPAVRRMLFGLFDSGACGLADLSCLNVAIGEAFAAALLRLIDRSGIDIGSIDLIGSHGQTVWHDPVGRRCGRRVVRSTLQIGEPSVIAERTGVTTVADFRGRDMAAGGEGAPLVPYVDHLLFAHRRKTRAVQNIGGIANVTYLPAGGEAGDVKAFDTGPGNMIIDHIVRTVTDGRRRYDSGGAMARKGRVHAGLLGELMRHPFLRRRPPKSTGREQFGAAFSAGVLKRAGRLGLAIDDLVATVTAFTAQSIAATYRRFFPVAVDQVILCGGGVRNRALVAMVADELHPAEILSTDDFGISADAKEAVSFAVLARETIRGVCNNVPSATGADRAVVLGKILPGQ